jgi:Flp pilus assembly pilin Flp
VKKYPDAETGQTTIEYVLVVLMVALVIFFALEASRMATIVEGAGEVIATKILEAIPEIP